MILIVVENGQLRTYHVFKDFEAFKKHVEKHLNEKSIVIVVK